MTVFRYALMMVAALPTTALAAWEYKEKADPMTDFTRGIATASSGKEAVIVKCDGDGSHQVYADIYVSKYLGRGRSAFREIEYRVDKGEIQKLLAYHSDNSIAVMNSGLGKSRDMFLPAIAKGSSLALRLTTFDDEDYTTVLDISGGREAIAKVIETCGDKTAPPL